MDAICKRKEFFRSCDPIFKHLENRASGNAHIFCRIDGAKFIGVAAAMLKSAAQEEIKLYTLIIKSLIRGVVKMLEDITRHYKSQHDALNCK